MSRLALLTLLLSGCSVDLASSTQPSPPVVLACALMVIALLGLGGPRPRG